MRGRTLWCLSKYSEMIAVQNSQLFVPLFKIATDTIRTGNEFPLRLVGATVAGSFARKIDKLELLENVAVEEQLAYNIGNPEVMAELLRMLRPIEDESNPVVIGVIFRLLMVNSRNNR